MDIYSETILEYFKNPANKGPLKKCTVSANEDNPLCGDNITIHLEIENNKIINATFEGDGCAISQASASMLAETIINKSVNTVKKMPNQKIYDMLGIEISPGRVKCALLGLTTTKKCLNSLSQKAKEKDHTGKN